MLYKFIAGLLLLAWLSVGSAAPSEFILEVDDATSQSSNLNFSSILSGFCGTSGACTSFMMPLYTDCNFTTCSCTNTVSQDLATCLQCGFDNTAGIVQSAAQGYLNAFTSACATNGTAVQNETIVIHSNGAGTRFGVPSFIVLWVVVSALGMSFV
ncbi:hypothetical protein BT96DRAFT_1002116 [Gymnopus androsaceus JB14]|uniref:Extracellular membrane protein CFEM domain-containing protein n=1 Tax=Gymnopus androsaceus JB14 TaxID=1447944 RepID=A0A6A4GZ19_9AGAR|nr:hypothetical protein BT96DRAFT_1002116 [Gymnopus androsaceus JB14]